MSLLLSSQIAVVWNVRSASIEHEGNALGSHLGIICQHRFLLTLPQDPLSSIAGVSSANELRLHLETYRLGTVRGPWRQGCAVCGGRIHVYVHEMFMFLALRRGNPLVPCLKPHNPLRKNGSD